MDEQTLQLTQTQEQKPQQHPQTLKGKTDKPQNPRHSTIDRYVLLADDLLLDKQLARAIQQQIEAQLRTQSRSK